MAEGGNAGGLMQFLPLIALIAVFYFMLIRPQKVQQKKRQEMLDSLKVGDKILTSGGLYGTITEVRENSIRVKFAKDVVMRMARTGVQSITSGKQDEE